MGGANDLIMAVKSLSQYFSVAIFLEPLIYSYDLYFPNPDKAKYC